MKTNTHSLSVVSESNKMKVAFVVVFLSVFCMQTYAQTSINHWGAAVLATDDWHYRSSYTEPPQGWMNSDFDDSQWWQGAGGIGYGDGDDNTIIDPILSVCIRTDFEVTDLSLIAASVLYADYDDSFVAYINGQEVARSNIGTEGNIPPFDATANGNHEANLYQGGTPEAFFLSMESLLQEGTNTLAVQVHNVNSGSSDLSAIFFLAFGTTGQNQDYRELPFWFEPPFTSSNLPLLMIQTDQNAGIPADIKIGADLGIIDNGPGQRNHLNDVFNGYDGRIGIEVRGASSLWFDKQGFGIETRDEFGENNNVPLLGMPEENDWVLHGPFSDKSLLRNVLSYHIGSLTGRYTPRNRLCEMFINGDYRGVYVLTEKIKRDDNRVDIANLREEDIEGDELTGGYIIKIDRHTNGLDDGWWSAYSDDAFYGYHDPSHDELLPIQKEYIRDYVNGFEYAVNSLGVGPVYEDYLDIPSFVDYFLATEIFKHIDGWKLSFFMYKTKDSNGGKLHFGPLWDLNLAYGNFDFARNPGPTGWSYVWALNNSLRPFWLVPLVSQSAVRNEINCRWRELRQTVWQTESLLQFIEDNAALLGESSERNFERWPVLGQYVWPNSFVGDTYEQEIDFLANWLEARLNWMDLNMLGTCIDVNSDDVLNVTEAMVYPNPIDENQLHIVFNTEEYTTADVCLTDAFGQLLLTQEIQSNKDNLIDMSNLPAGVYFYELRKERQLLDTGKLLKIR